LPRWPDGRIGLAFLGCGAVTRAHSRTLAQLDPCLERFYASRDPERARLRAPVRRGGLVRLV